MKLALLLMGCVVVAACGKGIRAGKPPETKVVPVKDTLHGTDVVDAYRWLEGDNSNPQAMGAVTPEVAAWTDAQNTFTRGVLDGMPQRAALETRITALMQTGSVTAPRMRGDRYFFSKREGSQNQSVVYVRDGYKGQSRALVDPAKLDSTGLTTIEWFAASQDGKQLAYGTYRVGDENTTLHLLDVDSVQPLPLQIPNKVQVPFWLPDGSGFVYQNLKDPKNPYSGQVMFHRMGTDPATDALIDRQFTKEENAKLATTWGPVATLSHDGHWLVLGYWIDTKSTDLWLVNFDDYRKTGKVTRRTVSVGEEGQAFGTVIDGTLYMQTTKGAPRGKIVAVDPAHPDKAHWREIIPERPDAVIASVDFAKGLIAVTYLRNASNTVEVFDMTGKSMGIVTQPGIGAVSIDSDESRTEAYLTYTSFNYPTTVFRVDLAKPAAEPELWERPDVPVDPSTVDVEQVWYRSNDGTRVSMFLVHKKGLALTGDAPTMLTGYGGFNISMTPGFQPHLFQWFEAGGLYAEPNLRGGGEYGEGWHEAGMLGKKQNVFDDFEAAAEWLIANKYTSKSKLAIMGGSNGGLLTGAAVTQRPDLFRAAIVAVPLLDMLRYQNFLMARYWVPEYGTAEDAEQFKFLLAYSPYQHVKGGTKYPAVFLTAGENDTRVHAGHARKMAAALQAASASDLSEQPILLWVDREAGHGQGKPLNLRVRDVVDQRIFVMWQLGMLK